jgi:hypothetical protein
MISNNFSILIENKIIDFDPGEVDYLMLSRYKQLIKDNSYFDFVIESKNCGFFYGQSLHMYGFSSVHKFNDIDAVNSLLQSEYGNIIRGLTSFGQDLFGNQFCFNQANSNIVLFNSETGEIEPIASSYIDWVNVLDSDLEYFTGINILENWRSKNQFNFYQRLCPKIPFIMGGEFKVDNLYAGKFPEFLTAYANIAKQIYNLPDGTKVKLNINKDNLK